MFLFIPYTIVHPSLMLGNAQAGAGRLQKQEEVRYSRQERLRYLLSNTNTGWVSTARSNSSREESAVTP